MISPSAPHAAEIVCPYAINLAINNSLEHPNFGDLSARERSDALRRVFTEMGKDLDIVIP